MKNTTKRRAKNSRENKIDKLIETLPLNDYAYIIKALGGLRASDIFTILIREEMSQDKGYVPDISEWNKEETNSYIRKIVVKLITKHEFSYADVKSLIILSDEEIEEILKNA